MARSTPTITPEVSAYAEEFAPAEDDVLGWLAAETKALGSVAQMQISTAQGAFLTALTRLAKPAVAVEIGTFTGYSSVCIARGLPPGSRLVCFDVSEEWTRLAREAWKRAGLDDRVELRLGPAAETLPTLDADGPIGLAFLDADKVGYAAYWDALVPRMAPGGLLLADNVLQDGDVADPSETYAGVVAIRAFNEKVRADQRVDSLLLPAFDGLTVATVRSSGPRG